MADAIAVDVGGTSIKAGAVDRYGRTTSLHRVETPATGPDGVPILDAIAAIVEKVAGSTPPAGVGVVVPGVVDEDGGVAVLSENLRWEDVTVGAELGRRLDLPVAVGHDVRAGGLAEHRLGACRGYHNAAFVPVGTGIAAALVVEGTMYRGDGYAGEVGHIDVGHDLPCACGGSGCLEAIASAAAITRRYIERTGTAADGSRDVADRVRHGDHAAVDVWDEALDALARGFAALVGLMSPEVIVVGGGLGEASDLVIEPLKQRLDARLTFQRSPRLVPAELGDMAGCVGAGLLAWDLVDGVTGSRS